MINELVKNKKYSKYYLNKILRNVMRMIGDRPQFNYNEYDDKLTILNTSENHHIEIWKILNNYKKKLLTENIMMSIHFSKKFGMNIGDDMDLEIDKDIILYDYYIKMKDIILRRISPTKYVYHFTSKDKLDSIKKNGLLPGKGENWENSGESFNTEHPPAVFVMSDDSQGWYGDIKITIDTSKINNKWYQDLNFPNDQKVIMTFDKIPTESIISFDEVKRNNENMSYIKTFEGFVSDQDTDQDESVLEKESKYKLMDFINPLRLSREKKDDINRIKKLMKFSKPVGTSRFFENLYLIMEIDVSNGIYVRLQIDRHWTDITGRDLYYSDRNLLGSTSDIMMVEYYENVPNYYKGKEESGKVGKSKLDRNLLQDYFKLEDKYITKTEEVSLTPSLLHLFYSKYKIGDEIKGE